jgi:hypothetical protein
VRRLLVALAVLLAGCSTGLPTPGEPTPTLTPVSVPGDQTVALVSHAGVAPAAQLVAAHERELAGRPTVRTVYGGMFSFGPDYDYVVTVARNGSQYRATLRTDVERIVNDSRAVERTTREVYHTGDRVLVRTTSDAAVSYRTLPADTSPPFADVRSRQLFALFDAADLRVANSRSDAGHYRLYAETFAVDRLPTYRGVVVDATVSGFYATVTPDGYVVRYWLNYEGTLDGTAVDGWVRVGPSPDLVVERPDWYADAVNATAVTPTPATTGRPSTATPSETQATATAG